MTLQIIYKIYGKIQNRYRTRTSTNVSPLRIKINDKKACKVQLQVCTYFCLLLTVDMFETFRYVMIQPK